MRGEVVDAAKLRPLALSGDAPAGAAILPADVVGKVALTDIPAGQIVQTSLVSADRARAGLAVLVPEGRRAVAVRITDEIAVSNLVHPGDVVDVTLVLRENVLARNNAPPEGRNPSEARTLLQRVQVLTVGETVAEQPPAPEGAASGPARPDAARTLTLALAPEQVELLTLARSVGVYGLALRNPKDDAEPILPTIRLDELRGLAAAEEQAAAPEPRRPIELVLGGERGGEHRVIYSIDLPGRASRPAAGIRR